MKKLIITSILFLITITTTFADCKTETSKKDYGLNNLKSVILNIGEKIVKKSDDDKLIKIILILKNINGKNDKQKSIVGILKNYFECEINKDNTKITSDKINYYPSLHLASNYNKEGKGLKERLQEYLNNDTLKNGNHFSDLVSFGVLPYLKTHIGINCKNTWTFSNITTTRKLGNCHRVYTDTARLKFFIPPGTSFISIKLRGHGNGSSAANISSVKYNNNINWSTLNENSSINKKGVPVKSSNDNNPFQNKIQTLYANNGIGLLNIQNSNKDFGWLLIDAYQLNDIHVSEYWNYSDIPRYDVELNLTIDYDSIEFQTWFNNGNNFDFRGEPILEKNNLTKTYYSMPDKKEITVKIDLEDKNKQKLKDYFNQFKSSN